jgi:hypothetical protein
VDDRLGFSNSIYVKQAGGVNLRWYHYDNCADPTAIKQGQYGWHTRFDHLGLALPLSKSTRLNIQWITGDTLMGDPEILSVNTEFSAWHAGITQKYHKFHFDLRYEEFAVDDLDAVIEDEKKARQTLNLPEKLNTQLLQVALQWRF